MNNCLFCKIISGEIPSIKIYEDEHWFAFKDIEPCAPVHILLVPKVHVKNILGMTSEINHDFSDFFLIVKKIAEDEGRIPSGGKYRRESRAVSISFPRTYYRQKRNGMAAIP